MSKAKKPPQSWVPEIPSVISDDLNKADLNYIRDLSHVLIGMRSSQGNGVERYKLKAEFVRRFGVLGYTKEQIAKTCDVDVNLVTSILRYNMRGNVKGIDDIKEPIVKSLKNIDDEYQKALNKIAEAVGLGQGGGKDERLLIVGKLIRRYEVLDVYLQDMAKKFHMGEGKFIELLKRAFKPDSTEKMPEQFPKLFKQALKPNSAQDIILARSRL